MWSTKNWIIFGMRYERFGDDWYANCEWATLDKGCCLQSSLRVHILHSQMQNHWNSSKANKEAWNKQKSFPGNEGEWCNLQILGQSSHIILIIITQWWELMAVQGTFPQDWVVLNIIPGYKRPCKACHWMTDSYSRRQERNGF